MSLTIVDTDLVQSTLFAFSTLLVYDYVCTFDREVAYVWTSPSQWSAGTLLFFLNRYLPFIDTFMELRLKMADVSPETCKTQFPIISWFIVSGIMISEVILILRTYAIWGRKRSIFYILCVSAALTFTCSIIVTNMEMKSIKFIAAPGMGCHAESASVIFIVAYISLTVLETNMAILTAIKAYRDLRYSQSRWVLRLYREGLLFYLYLLIVSLANVLVPIFASRKLANWLATPQRVMHSVLTTRVLLLILQQRTAAGMTNRAPADPHFVTFDDAGVSTEISIAEPETTVREEAPPRAWLRDKDVERAGDIRLEELRGGYSDASSVSSMAVPFDDMR